MNKGDPISPTGVEGEMNSDDNESGSTRQQRIEGDFNTASGNKKEIS